MKPSVRIGLSRGTSAGSAFSNRRVILFAGHYGSGKTNIALNYARAINRDSRFEVRTRNLEPGILNRVYLADLDIVNPYFRTKDSASDLAREGIGLVVSEYANSNVDFPALPKEIYALTAAAEDGETAPRVVIDVGGDDRGALALGRYAPDILAENDFEYLAVINAARPLTRTVADTVEVLREIEAASSGLRFTGIVNNTNLGPDTTAETILGSLPYADGVAAALGVPVRFTCCRADLADTVVSRVANLFPIAIQKLYYQLS